VANDGVLDSNMATMVLTVTNQAPTAGNASYSVTPGQTLTVPTGSGLLQYASDGDGDALAVLLVTTTAHGTLTLHADGSFVYTPTAGFTGTDTFTYRVSDGITTSALATVTLQVGNGPGGGNT
jgi:VCBS repeat-containing protein